MHPLISIASAGVVGNVHRVVHRLRHANSVSCDVLSCVLELTGPKAVQKLFRYSSKQLACRSSSVYPNLRGCGGSGDEQMRSIQICKDTDVQPTDSKGAKRGWDCGIAFHHPCVRGFHGRVLHRPIPHCEAYKQSNGWSQHYTHGNVTYIRAEIPIPEGAHFVVRPHCRQEVCSNSPSLA
jgi:hypothetical protein